MFIKFQNKILTVEDHSKNNEFSFYFHGYVIWNDKLYLDNEFTQILIKHISDESIFENIRNYNGCFVIIFIKNNVIHLLTDRWGTYPIFYNYNRNNLFISDNWKSILEYTGKEIRKDSAIDILNFGYVLGNKTLLEDIYEFEPHSIYTISFKDEEIRYEREDYWHLKYNFCKVNTKSKEKEFSEIWQHRLKIYIDHIIENGNTAYIPLSGGLDSRLLVNEFDRYQVNLYLMTFGSRSDNFEIKAATKVAQNLSKVKDHFILFLNKQSIPKFLEFEISTNRITNAIFSERILYYPDRIKNFCKYFIPGYSGDFMAGSHLKYKMLKWKTTDDLVEYILKYKSSDYTKHCAKKKNHYETIRKSLISSIALEDDLISSFVRWDLENRQRRYIIRSAFSDQKKIMNVFLPFFDHDLFDFFLNLPIDLLLNKKLYINSQLKHLYNNNPKLIKIKNRNKIQKKIKNNFLEEYTPKLKTKLKQFCGIKNSIDSEKWSDNMDWHKMFDHLELPEFMDKNILPERFFFPNLLYLYNISQVVKNLKQL